VVQILHRILARGAAAAVVVIVIWADDLLFNVSSLSRILQFLATTPTPAARFANVDDADTTLIAAMMMMMMSMMMMFGD